MSIVWSTGSVFFGGTLLLLNDFSHAAFGLTLISFGRKFSMLTGFMMFVVSSFVTLVFYVDVKVCFVKFRS